MSDNFWSLTVNEWFKAIGYKSGVSNALNIKIEKLRHASKEHILSAYGTTVGQLLYDNIRECDKKIKIKRKKKPSVKIILPDSIISSIVTHKTVTNRCSRRDEDIIQMINKYTERIKSDEQGSLWWKELETCYRCKTVPLMVKMLYRMNIYFNPSNIAASSSSKMPSIDIKKNKIIGQWNVTVSKIRTSSTDKNVLYENIPTIGSKNKKSKPIVKQVMNLNYDTVFLDYGDQVFSFHKTKGKPCLLMSVESALTFLNSGEFFVRTNTDESKYKISSIPNMKRLKITKNNESIYGYYEGKYSKDMINCIANNFMIKCCNCSYEIKVINIVRQITNKIDKTSVWTYKNFIKRLPTLFLNNMEPYKYYCKNTKCEIASKGIIVTCNYDNSMNVCRWCTLKHEVNFHCINCYKCDTSYCEICGETPYHKGKACYGPSSAYKDIDEETLKVLKQTSKPCPSCLVWAMKVKGCDHMTCSMCKTHWCYRCMEKLDQNNPYRHKCSELLDGDIDFNYHR